MNCRQTAKSLFVRKIDVKYIFVLNYSSEKQDITLKTRMTDLYTTSYSEGMITLEPYETKVYQM